MKAENLPGLQREALRRLDLAARGGSDAGAHDLGRVGAVVQHQRHAGRHDRRQADAQRRQAEEHQEQLHQQRRVAEQFHIGPQRPAQPAHDATCVPSAPAMPMRGAERHTHDGEQQRDPQPVQQHRPALQDRPERQVIAGIHGFRPRPDAATSSAPPRPACRARTARGRRRCTTRNCRPSGRWCIRC